MNFAATARGWCWVVLLLACGCSAPSWKDRLHDAAEIFDASVTVGPGVSISGRVTEAAQLGVGAFYGHAVGLEEGRWAAYREQRGEFGASILHYYEYRRDGSGRLLDVHHPRWADPGYEEYPLSKDLISDRRVLDVGLSFHIAFLGVDLAFRPDELVDFVAGCFGADPAKDDAYAPELAELHARARSLDGRDRAEAFDALLRRGEGDHGYAIYTIDGIRTPRQRRAVESLQDD